MKKVMTAVLLLVLVSCQINPNEKEEQDTTIEKVSIVDSEPDPLDNMHVPTDTTSNLKEVKWNGIKELTDETYKSEVLASSAITLVDFNATWCGPCRQQKPILDKLVKEYAGKINFASVDVDECPQTAESYRISSIPTLLFTSNGNTYSSTVGLTPYEELKANIDKILKENK